MKQRFLEVENYKNIGVDKINEETFEPHPCPAKLVLNSNYQDDKMGGLVVVIGENNAGKSNVLKALKKFSFEEAQFFEDEFPSYIGHEDSEPDIRLKVKNYDLNSTRETECCLGAFYRDNEENIDVATLCNKQEADRIEAKLQESINKEDEGIQSRLKEAEAFKKAQEQASYIKLLKEIQKIISKCNMDFYWSGDSQQEWEKLQESCGDYQTYDELLKFYKESKQFILDFYRHINRSCPVSFPSFDPISPPDIPTPQPQSLSGICSVEYWKEQLEGTFPAVMAYARYDHFSNHSLIVKPKHLEESEFFKSLLSIINQKPSVILGAYKKSEKSPGFLVSMEEQCNDRLKTTLTKRFNNIYGKMGDDLYRFKLKLDKDEISLSIFKGKDTMVLDEQSDGFKWFFDLYFKILNRATLKSGDIVLMDEPAHKLSPIVRKECADFLRRYGAEHGITFVVVTHDVFWVDVDHLNELRIVREREGGLKGAMIQNDFSHIESSDTDTMLYIKKAFGVGIHVFYSPDVRCIFVEGITDYNYLTTFKLLYEKEKGKECKLAFLPIAGLGKQGEEHKILKKLMKQSKDPVLLVDGDKAGEALQEIKNHNKYDQITIVSLKEIDGNYKEIENLFDAKDKERYGIGMKKASVSNAFKNHILWSKDEAGAISETSKENFYKVLEHLNNL